MGIIESFVQCGNRITELNALNADAPKKYYLKLTIDQNTHEKILALTEDRTEKGNFLEVAEFLRVELDKASKGNLGADKLQHCETVEKFYNACAVKRFNKVRFPWGFRWLEGILVWAKKRPKDYFKKGEISHSWSELIRSSQAVAAETESRFRVSRMPSVTVTGQPVSVAINLLSSAPAQRLVAESSIPRVSLAVQQVKSEVVHASTTSEAIGRAAATLAVNAGAVDAQVSAEELLAKVRLENRMRPRWEQLSREVAPLEEQAISLGGQVAKCLEHGDREIRDLHDKINELTDKLIKLKVTPANLSEENLEKANALKVSLTKDLTNLEKTWNTCKAKLERAFDQKIGACREKVAALKSGVQELRFPLPELSAEIERVVEQLNLQTDRLTVFDNDKAIESKLSQIESALALRKNTRPAMMDAIAYYSSARDFIDGLDEQMLVTTWQNSGTVVNLEERKREHEGRFLLKLPTFTVEQLQGMIGKPWITQLGLTQSVRDEITTKTRKIYEGELREHVSKQFEAARVELLAIKNQCTHPQFKEAIQVPSALVTTASFVEQAEALAAIKQSIVAAQGLREQNQLWDAYVAEAEVMREKIGPILAKATRITECILAVPSLKNDSRFSGLAAAMKSLRDTATEVGDRTLPASSAEFATKVGGKTKKLVELEALVETRSQEFLRYEAIFDAHAEAQIKKVQSQIRETKKNLECVVTKKDSYQNQLTILQSRLSSERGATWASQLEDLVKESEALNATLRKIIEDSQRIIEAERNRLEGQEIQLLTDRHILGLSEQDVSNRTLVNGAVSRYLDKVSTIEKRSVRIGGTLMWRTYENPYGSKSTKLCRSVYATSKKLLEEEIAQTPHNMKRIIGLVHELNCLEKTMAGPTPDTNRLNAFLQLREFCRALVTPKDGGEFRVNPACQTLIHKFFGSDIQTHVVNTNEIGKFPSVKLRQFKAALLEAVATSQTEQPDGHINGLLTKYKDELNTTFLQPGLT